jgi:hypothetical protein
MAPIKLSTVMIVSVLARLVGDAVSKVISQDAPLVGDPTQIISSIVQLA